MWRDEETDRRDGGTGGTTDTERRHRKRRTVGSEKGDVTFYRL